MSITLKPSGLEKMDLETRIYIVIVSSVILLGMVTVQQDVLGN